MSSVSGAGATGTQKYQTVLGQCFPLDRQAAICGNALMPVEDARAHLHAGRPRRDNALQRP
eukprot:3329904-Lingulodinium_polyedra.AAC.1